METLEERLERTKKEWEEEQERKKKGEEIEKFRKIEPTLTIPKPQKTAMTLLREMFDEIREGAENASWVEYRRDEDKITLSWATRSGILARFEDIRLHRVLNFGDFLKPVDETLRKEIRYHPLVDKTLIDPAFLIKEKFGPNVLLVLQTGYQDRGHYLEGVYSEGYFLSGVSDILKLATITDEEFSYELVSSFRTRPTYSLFTPLTQFTFPVTGGWRTRDGSVIITRNYEYASREHSLEIEKVKDLQRFSQKLDEVLQKKWPFLKELFDYWSALNKELEQLNIEYSKLKNN